MIIFSFDHIKLLEMSKLHQTVTKEEASSKYVYEGFINVSCIYLINVSVSNLTPHLIHEKNGYHHAVFHFR